MQGCLLIEAHNAWHADARHAVLKLRSPPLDVAGMGSNIHSVGSLPRLADGEAFVHANVVALCHYRWCCTWACLRMLCQLWQVLLQGRPPSKARLLLGRSVCKQRTVQLACKAAHSSCASSMRMSRFTACFMS